LSPFVTATLAKSPKKISKRAHSGPQLNHNVADTSISQQCLLQKSNNVPHDMGRFDPWTPCWSWAVFGLAVDHCGCSYGSSWSYWKFM